MKVIVTGNRLLHNLFFLCWRFALSVWYIFQFMLKHKLDIHASSCTYYFLVSLIPAVIVAGWGTAVLADKLGDMNNLELLNNIRLYTRVQKITAKMGVTSISLKTAGIIGVVYAVWGASALMRAIRNAFGAIFPAKTTRKGVITLLTAHVMVPLLMVIAVIVSSLSAALSHAFRWLLADTLNLVSQSTLALILTPLLTIFIIAVATYACFMLLSPGRPRYKPAIAGSFLFAVYYMLIQQGLSLVMVKLIAAYSQYGAIGGILILLLWAFLIFFGMFMAAECVHVINDFKEINYARYIYIHIKEKPSFAEKFLMLNRMSGGGGYITNLMKGEKRVYDAAAFALCKVISGEAVVKAVGQAPRTLRDGEIYNLIGGHFPSVEIIPNSDCKVLIVPVKGVNELMRIYPEAWHCISSGEADYPAYIVDSI